MEQVLLINQVHIAGVNHQITVFRIDSWIFHVGTPVFSGLDNILFYGENTRMLFGDTKESVMDLVAKFT